MRIIKKLIITTFAVGLIGSLGFAAEAKAATSTPLTVTIEEDTLTGILYEGEEVYPDVKYELDSEDNPVFTVKDETNSVIGTFSYDDSKYEFTADTGEFSFNITQMILGEKGQYPDKNKYDGRITVEVSNIRETKCIREYDPDDHTIYYDSWDTDHSQLVTKSNGDRIKNGLYKQTIAKTGGAGSVRAYYNGEMTYASHEYYDGDSFYAMINETIDFNVITDNSEFVGWTSGNVTNNKATISGATTYTAKFQSIATGLKISANTTELNVGKRIKFSATILPDSSAKYDTSKKVRYTCSERDKYFKVISDNEWEAKAVTNGKKITIKAFITLTDGREIESSNSIEVTIKEREYYPCDGFSIKAEDDFLTEGYSIILTPYFTKMGTLYNGIRWTVDGEGTLSGLTTYTQTGVKTVSDIYGVYLHANEGKIESGKTGTIKVTATIPQGTSLLEDATATYEITVYPKNRISYNDSECKLTCTSPAKVNTGRTDGVDSDNKDTTTTRISEVKGVKIHVLCGDNFLGATSVARDKGTSATIDSTTFSQIVHGIRGSLSGESADIKIKALPCDSDGKYNKHVYATTTVTVYRVTISYTKADGTAAEMVTYAASGQKLNVGNLITEGKVSEVDGKTDTTITVSSTAAQNKHTAVLGTSVAKSAAAANAGAANRDTNDPALDKVPKTGQDNTLVFVMVAVVVCAVGGGLYAYNRKFRKA